MKNINDVYNQEIAKVNGEIWESDHIEAAYTALHAAEHETGMVHIRSIDNGAGVIHQMWFLRGYEPEFALPNDNVFVQYEIHTVDNWERKSYVTHEGGLGTGYLTTTYSKFNMPEEAEIVSFPADGQSPFEIIPVHFDHIGQTWCEVTRLWKYDRYTYSTPEYKGKSYVIGHSRGNLVYVRIDERIIVCRYDDGKYDEDGDAGLIDQQKWPLKFRNGMWIQPTTNKNSLARTEGYYVAEGLEGYPNTADFFVPAWNKGVFHPTTSKTEKTYNSWYPMEIQNVSQIPAIVSVNKARFWETLPGDPRLHLYR